MQKKYLCLSILILSAFISPAQENGDNRQPAPPAVYNYVKEMPSTPFDLHQYLAQNIHYPDSARVHNTQGRAIVKFVVNEDGTVSDCQIVRSVSKEIDAEALRVVANMPRWKPGIVNGKYVKVYFTLPIVFTLAD